MQYSPMLVFHICSGTVGCLSGFVAAFLRKGSRRHGLAGNVFVISMLGLGASAVYLAFLKSQAGNFLGGIFICYLVATAWMTARRRDGAPGIFDWAGMLVALAVAATEVTLGLLALTSPTRRIYGNTAPAYFIFGIVVLLAVTGDVRMIARGGISGTARIARHLWRMCFAFFAAAGSIFLARAHLFPVVLRKTGILLLLSFLPLILMIFWLIRVRLSPRFAEKTKSIGRAGKVGTGVEEICA